MYGATLKRLRWHYFLALSLGLMPLRTRPLLDYRPVAPFPTCQGVLPAGRAQQCRGADEVVSPQGRHSRFQEEVRAAGR